MSIVLILLALTDRFAESNPLIYRATIYTTLIISAVESLDKVLGVKLPLLQSVISHLPLYDRQLSWVLPAVVVLTFTFGLKLVGVGNPVREQERL